MDQIISLKVLNWSDLQKCTCALSELNLLISWETEEFVVYSNMKIIGRLVDIEGAVLIYIYEICILKNLFKGHTKAELVHIRYPVLCLIDFFLSCS